MWGGANEAKVLKKMRDFAGLLKLVVCTIKQVASNIHVHVISFTNLNFIVYNKIQFEFYCIQ